MTASAELSTAAIRTPTRRSVLAYLAIMASLVVVKLILEFGDVHGVVESQTALFRWTMIGFLALVGGCAVWLGPRSGIPELWEPSPMRHKGLLLSAGLGLGLGAVNLAVQGITGYVHVIADAGNIATINVAFPASVPFYAGGAIIVESLYRLILITLPLWLIGTVLLRGRSRTAVFWTIAAITSLVEPIGQMILVAGHPDVMIVMGTAMYGLNILEAYLFRRNGFLAPLAFRLSFYAIWHVVGGAMGL